MNRFRHILNRLLAALSLLLCLAVALCWLSSHRKPAGWARSKYLPEKYELHAWHLGWERGRLGINYSRLRFEAARVKIKTETADGTEGTVYIPALMAFGYKNHWVAAKLDFSNLTPENRWEKTGVFVRRYDSPSHGWEPVGVWTVFVAVPFWMLFVLFSIWPSLWMLGWWRRRRKVLAGMCLNCGYDLRATPGKCPECGVQCDSGKDESKIPVIPG